MSEGFYDLCTLTMKFLLVTFGHWEVHGQENVPRQGPLIVTSNHLNMADPPLLSASIPRHITFMAKKELWQNGFAARVVGGFGAFPVARGERDIQALHMAEAVLRSGDALGMFPEGTRSRDCRVGRGHPGSALIALRSGAPILPVGITGTEVVEGFGFLIRRPPIIVTIGRPYHLPPVTGKLGRDELEAATALLMERIAELLPDRYRPLSAVQAGKRYADHGRT